MVLHPKEEKNKPPIFLDLPYMDFHLHRVSKFQNERDKEFLEFHNNQDKMKAQPVSHQYPKSWLMAIYFLFQFLKEVLIIFFVFCFWSKCGWCLLSVVCVVSLIVFFLLYEPIKFSSDCSTAVVNKIGFSIPLIIN